LPRATVCDTDSRSRAITLRAPKRRERWGRAAGQPRSRTEPPAARKPKPTTNANGPETRTARLANTYSLERTPGVEESNNNNDNSQTTRFTGLTGNNDNNKQQQQQTTNNNNKQRTTDNRQQTKTDDRIGRIGRMKAAAFILSIL